MMAKCPACGNSISSVSIEQTTLKGFRMKTLKGIIYSCPSIGCGAVFSVGVDPLAIQADTVADVVKALRGP